VTIFIVIYNYTIFEGATTFEQTPHRKKGANLLSLTVQTGVKDVLRLAGRGDTGCQK
jgi:hypothetical protein